MMKVFVTFFLLSQVRGWRDFPGACLGGYNTKIIRKLVDMDTCKRLCQEETAFRCRSVETNFKAPNCRLSAEDRFTKPADFSVRCGDNSYADEPPPLTTTTVTTSTSSTTTTTTTTAPPTCPAFKFVPVKFDSRQPDFRVVFGTVSYSSESMNGFLVGTKATVTCCSKCKPLIGPSIVECTAKNVWTPKPPRFCFHPSMEGQLLKTRLNTAIQENQHQKQKTVILSTANLEDCARKCGLKYKDCVSAEFRRGTCTLTLGKPAADITYRSDKSADTIEHVEF